MPLNHDIDVNKIAGRIVRVPNHRFQRHGTKSYVHALLKYHITPTKPGPYFMGAHPHDKYGNVRAKLGGRNTLSNCLMKKRPGQHDAVPEGEVMAMDVQHDSEYLCPVTIGTPGKTFNLDFDTGSADTWVWSTELSKRLLIQYAKDHSIYDEKHSSTFRPMHKSQWKIQYGDNSYAHGTVGLDTVKVGSIAIHNQAIELAEEMSTSFCQGVGDGLLGLAFGHINTVTPQRVHTPVENMIAQTDIPAHNELFTAYLGSYKDSNEADKGESFYTFGHIDKEALEWSKVGLNDIHYTAIDSSNGFWQFPSTSAKVNGTVVHLGASNTAIADTGTTLALVSDELCEAIYKQIKGAVYDDNMQGYIFPMATTAYQLPRIEMKIGEHFFYLQKEDLAYSDAGNGYVFGGVQSRGDMPLDILGDTFLKGIYAIFDVGNKRFGAVQRLEKFENIEKKMDAADKVATEAQGQVAPVKDEVQKPLKEEQTLKDVVKEETHKPRDEAGREVKVVAV